MVDAVEHGVDARDIVDDGDATLLRVAQQRVVAEVVRSDPHRADRLAGRMLRNGWWFPRHGMQRR